MAQKVTVDAAKGRALDFLTKQSIGPKHAKGTINSTDLSLAYTSSSEGKTCFYVFNIGDDNGFVIAGGDEAAQQILGYSSQGSFDYDTAPDNLRWWLSQYTEQIARAEAPTQEALAATTAYRAKAAQTRQNISPIMETTWDQLEPYNCMIPNNGTPYATGCVATAIAQVMKRWNYPEHGIGSYAYGRFSADFGNTTYQWGSMKSSYAKNDQAEDVGTLMYHAGVAVRMSYGTAASGGSSAFGSNAGPALVKYFGYSKSVRHESRDYFDDEGWEDLIYNELSNNRPVLYSGQSASEVGHEFVCDGYQASNNMFHINWGWSGYCDSYFTLRGDEALKPDGTGTGGAAVSTPYVNEQEITVNITPPDPNTEDVASPHIALAMTSTITDPMYMEVNNVKYEDNYLYDKGTGIQRLGYTIYVSNLSCVFNHSTYFPDEANVKIQVGVKVVERDYPSVQYFSLGNPYLDTNASGVIRSSSHSTEINLSGFEYNGTYELHPVYRIEGEEEWSDIQVPASETIPTVTITGANNHTDQYVNFVISSSEVMVGKTVQITHDSNYQGAITYISSDPEVASVDDQGVVTGVSAGTATITVTGTADPERLYLETTATFNVQVNSIEKSDLHFTLENNKNYIDVGDFNQLKWADDYDGVVSFTSSDPTIATVDGQGKITGVSEGTVVITASAAETTYYYATEATFTFKVVILKASFVEPPHFNNDNNTYRNDMVFYYTIRNDCDITHDIKITATLNMRGSSTRIIVHGNVSPNGVVSDSFDFGGYLNTLANHNLLPGDNTKYSVDLYLGNGQYFENCKFVEFTYRKTMDYKYFVSPAGYGTLVLPFNANLPDDLKAYSCSGVDNDVLILQEENSIRRNVPYIVKGTPDHSYNFTGPEAIDSDKQIARVNDDDILIGALGSNVPLEIGTDYIMQVHEDGKAAFYHYMGAPASPTATQFRAFLRFPETTAPSSQAPKINFPGNGDDETEGISTLSTDTLPAGIYTLDGHRQSSFQKGMNILIFEDGTAQKVFVK